jgi:hypothetical protein
MYIDVTAWNDITRDGEVNSDGSTNGAKLSEV